MALYSPGGLNLADTTAPLILAFDNTGTTDVVFAVSSSGDLTITPDGGDVTIAGNFASSKAGDVTWTMEDTTTGVAASTRTNGILQVKGRDVADATVVFQDIVFNSADAAAGVEDGTMLFRNMVAGTLTTGITLAGIDVTVAGTLAVTGTSSFTGAIGIGKAAEATHPLTILNAGTNTSFNIDSSNATPFGMYIDFSAAAPNDTTQYFLRMDDSAGLQAVIYSDGSYQGSANSYGGLSDRRLKQNIVAADSNWDRYKQLKWSDFQFIATPEQDRHGLIAQDVLEVFPDCVYEDGQTGMYAINYMGIATETGKAVQECQVRIEEAESREDRLEGCVRHLVDVNPKFEGRDDALALLEAA